MKRPVLVDPSGGLSTDLNRFHAKSLRVEAVDGRFSVLPRAAITQRSDDLDMFADQCRGVEIGRRKDRFRIAKDSNGPVRFMHKDVVVDAKVLVVGIFMLARDLNKTAIRQQGDRLSKALPAPDRRVIRPAPI